MARTCYTGLPATPVPAGGRVYDRLMDSSLRLPTWVRAVTVVALPFVAFATAFANRSGSSLLPLMAVVFVGLTAAVLYTHLPIFAFDGPLPFSERGVHASGGVLHPWESITTVRPSGERHVEAVTVDGEVVRLRTRGRRTRDDLRDALARHRPEVIDF